MGTKLNGLIGGQPDGSQSDHQRSARREGRTSGDLNDIKFGEKYYKRVIYPTGNSNA